MIVQSTNPAKRGTVQVLLGVSGSIAAAHLPEFLLQLRLRLDVDVRALMSRSAHRFITKTAVAVFSGRPVLTDDDWAEGEPTVAHVEATRGADVFLVMPATANILAKAAHGIADDLLSASILASSAPVVLVPAMNKAMWQRPVTQDNVRRAEATGYRVFASETGIELLDLTPGGVGLPRPTDLVTYITDMLGGDDALRSHDLHTPTRVRSESR